MSDTHPQSNADLALPHFLGRTEPAAIIQRSGRGWRVTIEHGLLEIGLGFGGVAIGWHRWTRAGAAGARSVRAAAGTREGRDRGALDKAVDPAGGCGG